MREIQGEKRREKEEKERKKRRKVRDEVKREREPEDLLVSGGINFTRETLVLSFYLSFCLVKTSEDGS